MRKVRAKSACSRRFQVIKKYSVLPFLFSINNAMSVIKHQCSLVHRYLLQITVGAQYGQKSMRYDCRSDSTSSSISRNWKRRKNEQANCCEVNLQDILIPTMPHGCCHVTKQTYWGYGFWVLLSLQSACERNVTEHCFPEFCSKAFICCQWVCLSLKVSFLTDTLGL